MQAGAGFTKRRTEASHEKSARRKALDVQTFDFCCVLALRKLFGTAHAVRLFASKHCLVMFLVGRRISDG